MFYFEQKYIRRQGKRGEAAEYRPGTGAIIRNGYRLLYTFQLFFSQEQVLRQLSRTEQGLWSAILHRHHGHRTAIPLHRRI